MPHRDLDPSLSDREILGQLQRGQQAIKEQLDVLQATVRDVVTEIGDVPHSEYRDPDRRSIRRRLHDLEEVQHAASAAGAALGLLFGRATRWAMVTGIIIAATTSLLRLAGVGG